MRWLSLVLVVACNSKPAQKQIDAAPDIDATLPPDALIDAAIDAPPDADPLATLFGTGLCVDHACTQIQSGISAYTPRWPLWADAASKRRWIYLPPGAQIDTTDMDHWVFPLGTKLWKEFSVNGVRVETRFIEKVASNDMQSDWYYVAYQWNATQDDALAVPTGVVNANGTTHDIPPRVQCIYCHDNLRPSRVLGFQALQLDYANPTSGELDLDHAIAAGMLTTNPAGMASPHFPMPTNGTTDAIEALGYLHANCGHCHNPGSDVYINNGIPQQLRLTIASLGSVTTTPTYMTDVGVDGTQPQGTITKLVNPGMPDNSLVIFRFESASGSLKMPPVAVKNFDPTADTTLRTWITNLPP